MRQIEYKIIQNFGLIELQTDVNKQIDETNIKNPFWQAVGSPFYSNYDNRWHQAMVLIVRQQ